MKHPAKDRDSDYDSLDRYDETVARFWIRKALEERGTRPLWRLAFPAPAISASALGYSRARRELTAARRDLIELAAVDIVACASRVRRIQADMRRIWLPELRADYTQCGHA